MKVIPKKPKISIKKLKFDKKVKKKNKKSHKPSIKKPKKKLKVQTPNKHIQNKVTNYTAINNPLDKMLSECSEEKLDRLVTVNDIIENNFDSNKFKVHTINCQIPESKLFEDDISIKSDFEPLESDFPIEASTEQSFISAKIGEYQLHHIENGAIFLLHANSKVFLHGFMQLKILHGEVEVLGKILNKNDPVAKIFSPRCSAYMYIQNLNVNKTIDEDTRKSLRKQLIELGIDSQTSREIAVYKLKSKTVIAHCINVFDKATEFLQENLPQQIYPMKSNSLHCVFKNYTSTNWNPILTSPDWENLAIDCKQNNKTLNQIMLCGGKGVGKSTLLRYLVNSYLNDHNEVYVLDLDPGQPEFTVPGSLSLVKVTSPLLGPNYTHLQETEITLFIPHIDVSADHHRYISTVQKIAKFLPLKGTVFVNYMGFNKGLGVFLTASVINILKPQLVVQLVSNNESKNYHQDLTLKNVQHILNRNKVLSDYIKPYTLMKIPAMTTGNNDNGWELRPKAVREMCVLSYMSKILPDHCNYLTDKDVEIYRTSLNNITILINGRPSDPMVANGNLVALCKEKDKICLGWGIVRAICQTTKTIFLITPIGEKLEEVTHLVIGSVALPSAIYLRHSNMIQGTKPYISQGEISHFGKTPKRNIQPKVT